MLGWCYWIFIQSIIIDPLLSPGLANTEGQDIMLVDVECGGVLWSSLLSPLQS